MDNTGTGAKREPQGGRSYRRVAVALLGLVVILLAAAFFLDRHLRSHVGIQRLTPPISKKAASSPGTGQGTTAPSPGSPTPAILGTLMPTVTPAPTLTPRQQVIVAYHRYWRFYRAALYTLNTASVAQVAADGELQRIEAEVAGFRRQNYAVRVRVSHHPLIVSIRGDTATIYDEILNRSFAIDPVTKRPGQGSNQSDLEKDIYTLKRIHGVWKVTRLVHQQG